MHNFIVLILLYGRAIQCLQSLLRFDFACLRGRVISELNDNVSDFAVYKIFDIYHIVHDIVIKKTLINLVDVSYIQQQ